MRFTTNEAVTNFAPGNRVERRRRDGREYLVCPVTMLIGDRVLNGSQGRLFYPRNEVERNLGQWNGVPLTYRHPTDAHGRNVSARDADPGFRIGTVYGDAVRNGRRVAEAWFDVERLRNRDPKLLRRLERGEQVELSTGLYTENVPSSPGSGHDYVARNYRPDHLAILPDQTGACSLRDGCGVGVANVNFAATFDFLSKRRHAMQRKNEDVLDIPTLNFGNSSRPRGPLLTNDHLEFAVEDRSGSPTTKCRQSWPNLKSEEDDILDMPVLNFGEKVAPRENGTIHQLNADVLEIPSLDFRS